MDKSLFRKEILARRKKFTVPTPMLKSSNNFSIVIFIKTPTGLWPMSALGPKSTPMILSSAP